MTADAIPLSVLVADDDPDLRLLMRATLTSAGMRVVAEAVDGVTAVEGWRLHQPDVVVTDLRMPRMSGLEAAAAILAESPTQAIVMCSAYADTEAQQAALEVGVAACVDKTQIYALDGIVREAHRKSL